MRHEIVWARTELRAALAPRWVLGKLCPRGATGVQAAAE